MFTLAQMCHLTGVTRRTLQDYNALGLLPCREKTPGGYWLYDEADLQRLQLLQMLLGAGYTRKELQTIIPAPDMPMDALLAQVQASLEQKQHRLAEVAAHIARLRQQEEGEAAPTENLPGD